MQEIEAVILAKGAPVRTSEGKVAMCAIAVSEVFGLIRLYPLAVMQDVDVRVWSVVRVTARRSTKDSRTESWRTVDCQAVGLLQDSEAKSQLLNDCLLRSGSDDPIKYQNERRGSIAIVKADGAVGCGLRPREAVEQPQQDADEPWVLTQDQHPLKPYLFWRSVQGVQHETHLLAQEVYMGLQRNASTPFRVFENMHVGDPDFEHWLVLGNMRDRRTVWVCPHLHRLKKTISRIRTSFLTFDGRGDDWPYLTQEAVNAKDAGPQKTFTFTTSDT